METTLEVVKPEVEKTELVIVDPKEFGLDEQKGKEVESVFAPLIAERQALTIIYEQLIVKEITPEVAKEANELGKKLMRVRTGTDKIHKASKAFYLAGGRFIDAWKNKNNSVVETMETRVSEIAEYYERQEAARIEKLTKERETELIKFEVENVSVLNLGLMADDVYDAFRSACEKKFIDKKEAIVKAEQERIAKEQEELLENERIRKENEELKAQQEAREKEIAAKNQLRLERNAILKKYNWVHDSDTADLTEQEFSELVAEQKCFFEDAEKKRIEQEEEEARAREQREQELKEEREKKEALEKELAAKKKEEEEKLMAELLEKQKAEKLAEEELNKGDAAKFADLIKDLEALTTKYSFKSKKFKTAHAGFLELLNKTINYLISKK